MAECEEEWKRSVQAGEGGARPEVTIPDELRLAYKDDMERGPPTPMSGSKAQTATSNVADGDGLAPAQAALRGPIGNVLARSKPPPSPLRAVSATPEAREETKFPEGAARAARPTPGALAAASAAARPPMTGADASENSLAGHTRHHLQSTSAAVPKWIDIAIVVLAVTIAYLAIGKAFA